MKRNTIKISYLCLRDVLQLPADVEIIDVAKIDWDASSEQCTLLLQGDGLPGDHLKECCVVRETAPIYEADENGKPTFKGWL